MHSETLHYHPLLSVSHTGVITKDLFYIKNTATYCTSKFTRNNTTLNLMAQWANVLSRSAAGLAG